MSTPTSRHNTDRTLRSERSSHLDPAAADQASPLARSALAFAVRAHAGERRVSDGAPFVEHPLDVQRLLRAAGCSDSVAIAGLLHDTIGHTEVRMAELTARFGSHIAELVRAVSDDMCVLGYRQRKQMLREQVRDAGYDAALVFCADKISKVRELPDHVRRDRARFDTATARDSRAASRMRSDQQMRLQHYHASLAMLQLAAPGHPLVNQLEHALAKHPITSAKRAPAHRRARRSRHSDGSG